MGLLNGLQKETGILERTSRKGKKLGVGRKLTNEEEAQLFNLIATRRPFQVGFKLPYKDTKLYLWTRDLLRQLIHKKFDVVLTDGGVVNYLTRWGVPPLNRNKSKQKQCHVTIQAWLELNLQNLITRSKIENAQLFWVGDIALVGLQANEKSRQKRLSMIQVISNQGRLHWLTVRGEFDPERQVMLLESLIGQFNNKIYLIRNSISHFNNGLVIDWLNKNQSRLELLPPQCYFETINTDDF